MAYLNFPRVMVSTSTSFIVFLGLTSLTAASICPENKYLNSKLQECLNCTDCPEGTVVLRPCEFHRDTLCGPITELLKTMESGNPHRHKHQKHHQKHREHIEDKEIVWKFGDQINSSNISKENNLGAQVAALEVASSEAPFSSAETIVWDWQAVALTSAVFACILFFLVIALYSLHQAKQWRRLKENFEADVEELSARLSLMAASNNEKGEFPEQTGIGPINDANYLNSRCVYLEQLLSVRKDGNKTGTLPRGNVYIEEANSKT